MLFNNSDVWNHALANILNYFLWSILSTFYFLFFPVLFSAFVMFNYNYDEHPLRG